MNAKVNAKERDQHILKMIADGTLLVDAENGIVYGMNGKPVGHQHSAGIVFTLIINGSDSTFLIRRVVWLSVHGSIPDRHEVFHKDGNKADNRIANLEVAPLHRGERNGRAKLSNTQVEEIRVLLLNGVPQYVIAHQFQVSSGHISRIHIRDIRKNT